MNLMHADAPAAVLAAAGPDLPVAARIVLAVVFALALLSVAARYRGPSSNPPKD
ncbi:hypothetical protein ACIQM4_10705 [Streptomyces sp. NPDC091272]|uniref:hypothetical protein n=1 Tax=Streptomyces sp. NPDC091272 TaxID=3365981 RepID=UPI003803D38D